MRLSHPKIKVAPGAGCFYDSCRDPTAQETQALTVFGG